ncbi:MAG: hypothetical protein LC723_12270 [Actinobacteria bacterium]|nr:hypothetical protein [Actinomycetota bacterium]
MRARYPVKRQAFTGITQDDYGNNVESWAAPVTVYVYGVNYPDTSEAVEAGPNRLVVDRVLLIPKNFEANERDRFSLPHDSDNVYEVIGTVETAEGNPFGWNPGGRLKLSKVVG